MSHKDKDKLARAKEQVRKATLRARNSESCLNGREHLSAAIAAYGRARAAGGKGGELKALRTKIFAARDSVYNRGCTTQPLPRSFGERRAAR